MSSQAIIKEYKDVAARHETVYGKLSPHQSPYEDPYILHHSIEGVEFDFLIANENGKIWYEQDYTGPGWRLVKKLIRPGDTVIDCGAHHGLLSIFYAKLTGSTGKLIAIEPFRHNCDIIEFNAHINGVQNVEVRGNAVGKGDTTVSTVGDTSRLEYSEHSGKEPHAPCISLDAFADLSPAFIKLDIEGFECDALEHAPNLLKSQCVVWDITIHRKLITVVGGSMFRVIDLLRQHNYTLVRRDPDAKKGYTVLKDSHPLFQERCFEFFALPKHRLEEL